MKKILVVDDNPDIGRLLEVTLAGSYEVVVATDGVSGAQAVSDHRPDAVLLDHMLPGQMQGLQVLQNIKTDPLQKHILVAMPAMGRVLAAGLSHRCWVTNAVR